MVCLFLDDSKSWQLGKKRRNFTMDDHPNFNPQKNVPQQKESLLYTPENAHCWTPKNAGFESMIIPFLSGQPAGRFVVRPGIWIRRYDSSSPWLWGAAGPMMAQWTTQTNSKFTPRCDKHTWAHTHLDQVYWTIIISQAPQGNRTFKNWPKLLPTRKWTIFQSSIFRGKLAVQLVRDS